MTVVDPFGGPGGWDIAARSLGIDPIGIEYEPDACATRRVAGLRTVQADLTEFELPDHVRLDGLIASPPCPDYSSAGSGAARAEIGDVLGSIETLGCVPDCYSVASQMVGLPILWALRHRPRWIALEQVPPVLPIWEATARVLKREGWNTWTGILCAADYGVPQQRNRAFLLAHRDRLVAPPEATHAEHPQPSLFGGCPEPWVTMAEALGVSGTLHTNVDQRPDGSRQTGGSDRPAPTVAGSSVNNWVFRRPSTTVQGDSRIWPPGHKINRSDSDRLGKEEAERRYGDRAGTEAIKVTPAQAAALQSFPAGYPFQGSKSSQAKQIGNAVPPLMARHILQALLS